MSEPELLLCTDIINICGSGKYDCFKCKVHCPQIVQAQQEIDIKYFREVEIPKAVAKAKKEIFKAIEVSGLLDIDNLTTQARWQQLKQKRGI